MNKINPFLIAALSILLLTSCSSKPTAVPIPDTPEPTPELIEPAPTTTEVEEMEAEDSPYEIEETKTTLPVYPGARGESGNTQSDRTVIYNNDYWEQLLAYYRSQYDGQEDHNGEKSEWWSCTTLPAGSSDPPPWTDQTYPCLCSNPGAY